MTIFYEDLEALYNYVILWSDLIPRSDIEYEKLNIMDNDVYVIKDLEELEILNLMKKCDFRELGKENKVRYTDIITLFETNKIGEGIKDDIPSSITPYDIVISLMAIMKYLKLWEIHYPVKNNVFNYNYIIAMYTYIEYNYSDDSDG